MTSRIKKNFGVYWHSELRSRASSPWARVDTWALIRDPIARDFFSSLSLQVEAETAFRSPAFPGPISSTHTKSEPELLNHPHGADAVVFDEDRGPMADFRTPAT